jgi:hypothetical protein
MGVPVQRAVPAEDIRDLMLLAVPCVHDKRSRRRL